jgi:hypothetical protein
MNPVDAIREQAAKIVLGDDPEGLRKAAELLKIASDLELQHVTTAKLDADRKKVEQDLSSSKAQWKELLTAIIPLATTAILAGTLVFQIIQNHQSNLEKRAEEARQDQQREETRFTDALKMIQTSENISPAATLLNTFTREPQKTEARQMAMKLLLRSQSMDDFRDIFSATIEPVGPADLPILEQLDRQFYKRYSTFPSSYISATQTNDWSKLDKLSLQERSTLNFFYDALVLLSQKITLVLQRPGENGSEIDLSDVAITNSDIRGANLTKADLSNAVFTSVRMDGCDLGSVTKFQDAQFFWTAWWHASRISQPLLQYLEKTWPYHQGSEYPGPTTETAESYKQNVTRLESSLGQS